MSAGRSSPPCGSGVTACILALALALIDAPVCPIYDGSWEEWGGREDLPIETGIDAV